MPIKIEISGDDARHAQREMLNLLRGTTAYDEDVQHHLSYKQNEWIIPDYFVNPNEPEPPVQSSTKITEQEVEAATERAAVTVTNTNRAGESEEQHAAQRERGQASPGKTRRTKAEIAEDEAADKADSENITDESGESSGMSISSGEERISPEDEETVQQDAADEAAETERNGGLVPRERLRKALGALGMKAGVAAVQPGGVLGMTVDQVPDDEIEAAIAKLEAAKQAGDDYRKVLKEPAKQEDVKVTLKAATKDDLMQAMLDYAEIFDGTRDPKKAVLAAEDCGRVFQLAFQDEAVKNLSAVPADGYDKAIVGIREAIEKNPFKRTRQNG
jgi:hypothetical protein